MTEEKNQWLDINMPFISKENRFFLIEENYKDTNFNINKLKGNYIKSNMSKNTIAILIDDDVRILNEAKMLLKNKVVPIQ